MLKKLLMLSFSVLALILAFAVGANVGRTSTGQPIPTETAVLTGVLMDDQTIPLPTYADGTTADEADCRWIVSANFLPADGVHCYTDGRTVQICGGFVQNCTSSATANYMIVATRQVPAATPASGLSWGAIKATYLQQP